MNYRILTFKSHKRLYWQQRIAKEKKQKKGTEKYALATEFPLVHAPSNGGPPN